MRLRLPVKAMLLVVIPTAVQLIFVASLAALLHESEEEAAKAERLRQTAGHINRFLLRIMFGAAGTQASAMANDRAFLNFGFSTDMQSDVYAELEATKKLVNDDPYLLARILNLEYTTSTAAARLQNIKKMLAQGYSAQNLRALVEMRKELNDISHRALVLLQDIRVVEATAPRIQAQKRQQIQQVLLMASALSIAIALAMVYALNKDILLRLNIVNENSVRFALGKPISPPLPGNDEIAQLDQTFHMMTEMLAESTRKEHAVIENARDVICSIDSDLKFTAVNRAAQTVWGYEPEELYGQRIRELIFADDLERAIASFETIIREGNENAALETRLVHKDGTAIDALWSIHWSAQEKSLFCVVHDISERKKVERLKQEFVNMISHDLRTPLTSVKGTLSLLSEGVYDAQTEAGKNRLNTAQSNIDRLIGLINDLLDIEKLEAGMLAMATDQTALAAVIESAIAAVSGFAEQQQITLKSIESADVVVMADSDRLTQVLVNLLSNAIKFSPRGSTVTVTMAPSEAGFAQVCVTDQGRGVPLAHRESIFERFKQVDAADGKPRSGTGLGLAICRAIIQAHGGTIGVSEGDSGQGSVFWFRIPVAVVEPAPVSSS